MASVYLGIGTNVGDRFVNVSRAVREISRYVRVYASSPVYETAPVGYLEQDLFWNLVVYGSTSLSPRELLVQLKSIEKRMGRVATFANGPRLIDIDILFYGVLIVDDGDLVIPHPRAMSRAFVLRPLSDLAPSFVDPRSGVSVSDALRLVDDSDVRVVTA